MQAAVLNKYNKNGSLLSICDIPTPKMGDNDVLVKIKTAGVNPLDNMIIRGEVKLIVPYKCPLVMGNEFCGVVEAIGSRVSGFKKGDRVYGRMPLKKIGAFAEYAAVDQNAIAKVPLYLNDEQAAAVPLAALTALQAFELLNVQNGETVFISGGTGSLGAMAIPLAKSMGLSVIVNGSVKNKDRVMRLGADRFIDYRKEDYSKILSEVDYILDTVGISELEKEFSVLKAGGKIVSLRGLPNGEFAERMGMPNVKRLLFKFAGSKYDKMAVKKGQKYFFVFVREDGAGLKKVSEIFETQKIEPSVDEVYELSDINKALEKIKSGGSKGKTILKID